MQIRAIVFSSLAGLPLLVALGPVKASDHDDTPQLKGMNRHDARITDLHVFRRDDKLVLILCTNPAIPPSAATYLFPPDLTLRIFLDNHSPVRYGNVAANQQYGGTVAQPAGIGADVAFEVTFDGQGRPMLRTTGLHPRLARAVRFDAGLRDDPFIRTPRRGRNVAAVVIEVPILLVMRQQPTLLVWATSSIPDVPGPMADLGGRALRSQFAPNMPLNSMPPDQQFTVMGMVPDVVIYNLVLDLFFGVTYPNGRAPDDDVIAETTDIPAQFLGPNGLLTGEPDDRLTGNDKPFLETFPYLAPPHPPTP